LKTLGAQLTTVRNAPSCGITYDPHSDNSRGVIYDHNIFILQAPGDNFILRNFVDIST
jgi:hypothetical protein